MSEPDHPLCDEVIRTVERVRVLEREHKEMKDSFQSLDNAVRNGLTTRVHETHTEVKSMKAEARVRDRIGWLVFTIVASYLLTKQLGIIP